MNSGKTYIAIDLKSFYASVECVERNLPPLTTNLVVADKERTEKTICLAVTPSLKSYGISGRARLFEVVEQVKKVNLQRKYNAPNHQFSSKSFNNELINKDKSLELDYLIAPPRMALYVEYSTKIYDIYLRYIAPEDIYVYSIDEVFMDVTNYLATYRKTASQLAQQMISEVLNETGITATAGIGPNLFLCKVAMDIVAKHIEPDENGVRIATLDEKTYRKTLWNHTPITDFWRVGKGYAKKLSEYGIYTMGDIAKCSVGSENQFYNEDLLYKIFGINAELLIDHAWGYEPTTISQIKAYKPSKNSLCSGQVLLSPYTFEKAKIVLEEMADALSLDMLSKGLCTNQLVLTIGFDRENLENSQIMDSYSGEITTDLYGRQIPKHAHGTKNINTHTSSSQTIIKNAIELYEKIVNPHLLIRKITLTANNVIKECDANCNNGAEQLNLFTDYEKEKENKEILKKEKKMATAVLSIKNKYGKNAIVKGVSLKEGATGRERNKQIGGHKA